MLNVTIKGNPRVLHTFLQPHWFSLKFHILKWRHDETQPAGTGLSWKSMSHTLTMVCTVQVPRTCRVELKHPHVDWEQTLTLAATPGLSSEQSSFLWRMIHDLLPTRERLYRLSMPDIPSQICDLCSMDAEDNTQHALLQCPFNTANSFLLRVIQNVLPHAQPNLLLLLQLNVEQDMRLPITFAHIFNAVSNLASKKIEKVKLSNKHQSKLGSWCLNLEEK